MFSVVHGNRDIRMLPPGLLVTPFYSMSLIPTPRFSGCVRSFALALLNLRTTLGRQRLHSTECLAQAPAWRATARLVATPVFCTIPASCLACAHAARCTLTDSFTLPNFTK